MWENVHRSREMFNLIEARPPPIDLLNKLCILSRNLSGSLYKVSHRPVLRAMCCAIAMQYNWVAQCHVKLQVKLMEERADARTSGPKHEQATKSDLITFVKRSIKWQMYFGNFHFQSWLFFVDHDIISQFIVCFCSSAPKKYGIWETRCIVQEKNS